MKKTTPSNNTFLPLPVIELYTAFSCDKSWENMQPNEQGRHCQHCDQTIIDFRGKSTAEIVAIHEQSPHKVCGIYNQSQLQDKFTVPSTSIMKAALFSLIGLGLSVTTDFDGNYQLTVPISKVQLPKKPL